MGESDEKLAMPVATALFVSRRPVTAAAASHVTGSGCDVIITLPPARLMIPLGLIRQIDGAASLQHPWRITYYLRS